MLQQGQIQKVILILLALASLTTALNWQASGFGQGGWPGTMKSNKQPNLPQVYVEVDKIIDEGSDSSLFIAQNVSNALNALWDEAWNVAVAKLMRL